MGFGSRLKHAWNAFLNRDPTDYTYADIGPGYGNNPDQFRFSRGNERSIVTSIYNRIAMDCASVTIEHVRLDDDDRMVERINSGLNTCLNLEANVDQSGRAFLQDVYMSMFDEGYVGIVPVDTTLDPTISGSYEISSMRTAQVTEWHPRHVKVKLYNDQRGQKEEIILPKSMVALPENPFYAVMNEPNSTAKRLIHKLNLLDVVDDQISSGKLDLIIQLPYVIKSKARQEQAEVRRKMIEDQLAGSKYGIAYIDGTEHVTQLNRAAENNLLEQIEYLTNLLYSQLGLTENILNGSASEEEMLNYRNRTVEPIVSAVVDEMKRKFLTKTARSQKQSILFFQDPFKLVPVSQVSEIADKFTRNEIMTSNEIRQVIGMRPSEDPKADELRNSNLSEPNPDKSTQEAEVEELKKKLNTELKEE
ncbi:MAG: phage portal protein [Clostridiales bacterium]|nr:phage portal protein [Clostridiales bacterium]